MKKKIIILLAVACWALFSAAAVLDEWTFNQDANGTLLTNAINSGIDGSTFEDGGSGVLETDGLGALLSTPTNGTLWEGLALDADIINNTPLFLRYDLEYNLTNETHTVGTSIGISFVDSTGSNITGLVFFYDPNNSGSAPAGTTLAPVALDLALAGTLSAIAKVDIGANQLIIWYDTTDGNNFTAPPTTNALSISSINDLRIQATGEASPSGAGDFVAVKHIRVANSWADISSSVEPFVVTDLLTLTVAEGEMALGTLTLTNAGNVASTYEVTYDSPWISYLVETNGDYITTAAVHRVTSDPDRGTLPVGTQDIAIHVDASEQSAGTTPFTITITWGDGSTSDVAVILVVEAANPLLTVTPVALNFEGQAGFVTRTNDALIVFNSGNVALTYVVVNLGAAVNGYRWTNTTCNWESVWQQDFNEASFRPGQDSAITPWIPLEFDFLFYGAYYSAFFISIDGALYFGDEQILGPYLGDLVFDVNSSIRYYGDENHMAITWENMNQKGEADDLTFQAILHRDGTILFQYDTLSDADLWPRTDIGLERGSFSTEATLVRAGTADDPGTATYTTNYTVITNGWAGDWPIVSTNGTNVVVTYDETITDQALLFYPDEPIIISVDPTFGTLAVGEADRIAVLGDARLLMAGGSSNVTVSTLLGFLSDAPTASADVTFTATDSVEGTYPPIMAAMEAAMWGADEVPDIFIKTNPDGSRTLSWPAAKDSLSRTYTVWYTISLTRDWIPLAVLDNLTSYADTEHNNAPVIFYKVTVQ